MTNSASTPDAHEIMVTATQISVTLQMSIKKNLNAIFDYLEMENAIMSATITIVDTI